MNGQDRQETMKSALDEELNPLRFGGRARVLERTHPRGWRGRLSAWWNKELVIPVVPVAAVVALLAGSLLVGRLRGMSEDGRPGPSANRVLVKEGENYYWQDEYEKAVASIETEDSR
ncbi:hypothetical protein [Paenibacillus glycinis]|uniref:Uncharacterized protein n=1 Tax=Paenibacillus glycinis TaxID=2697035 RepID=A0ABW9XKH2_9BACL|nr:hypothetical protein [Paenibacillus glycinis]NBD23109.1 hypothetical protein [Paenibacillus glycinis]